MAAVDFGLGWYPAALMEGDFIVPEQLSRNGNRSGELRLLMAVFEDGIRKYCEQVSRGSTTSFEYREAEDWILSSDSDAITSFASLCELFGIDPQRARRVLLGRNFGGDSAVLVTVSGENESRNAT